MEVEDMKRFLTILLALFLLVMTMPALAENSEWEFDESKCTLTRYTGAGGEVAVPLVSGQNAGHGRTGAGVRHDLAGPARNRAAHQG